MLKLLKMDLYRLFHRKLLYVMIVALSAITLSMLFLSEPSTVTISSVLGVLEASAWRILCLRAADWDLSIP